MLRTIVAIPLALALCAPAMAATDPGAENRQRAALVEWTLANCDADSVPAVAVALSAMIANGSTPEQMAETRAWLRDRISENYSDTPAACADILATFAQP